jgi:RNA polymerase sigma-70 factor, ECF subfamily
MELINLYSHKRIQNGDIEAFEALFREFYAPLCRYAMSFTGSMDVAEEITQEFFYNYWKNRENIVIRSTVKGYLYQSVRNNALKYLEHEAVKRRYAQKVMESEPEKSGESQLEALEAKELQQIITDFPDEPL